MKVVKILSITVFVLSLTLPINNKVVAATVYTPMIQNLDANGYWIFNVADFITTGPWVDARNYNGGTMNGATIQAAVNAIGSMSYGKRTLLLAPGAWSISADLIIPWGVALKFEQGAYLDLAEDITVTIKGTIDAGLYKIFNVADGAEVEFWEPCIGSQIKDVYPQWWGALAGDTSDPGMMATNTAALKAAIHTKKMVLPVGTYSVNGNLGELYYGSIRGAGPDISVIKTYDANITLLDITGDAFVSGIGFTNGDCAAYINTGNVAATLIDFENCIFLDQATASIASDPCGYSASTLLNIRNCKFRTSTTSTAVTIDNIVACSIRDCWIDVYSPVGIYNKGTQSTMIISNLVGGSSFNNTDTTCWIKNEGSLKIDFSRFGGENGGRTIVNNYGPVMYTYPVYPTQVIITDSQIYGAEKQVVRFYELPNNFRLKNNIGYIGSYGLYLDPNISSASRLYFPSSGYFDNSDNRPIYSSDAELKGLVTAQSTSFNYGVAPLISDLISSSPTGVGYSDASTCPSTVTAYPYNAISGRRYAATADSQYINLYKDLPNGTLTNNTLYTLVVDLVCTVEGTVDTDIWFGDRREHRVIQSGQNIIAVPYFWSTDKSLRTHICIPTLSNGDVVHTGRMRVFKGNITQNTVNTVLYGNTGDSIPSSANIVFEIGDSIIHMDAAADGYGGRQCTTAGSPGTWKTNNKITQ